jgi:indolepyruvate ferredoxin oxidoreductase beta subunit
MTLPAIAPIRLLVCALGGEGGGVLAGWLVDIARACGHAAQSTSVPGVAQRTGATTYYVEVFPQAIAQLGGKRPVFGLNPVPGALDALVSSELLETARQIGSGMPTANRTLVITSSSRTLTTQERMVPGDGRIDSGPLLDLVRGCSRDHHVLDMDAIARACGTSVSAVMLGAIAASGIFPFGRDAFENAVRASGRGVPQSLDGFARSWEQVAARRAHAAMLNDAPDAASDTDRQAAPGLDAFPPATRSMLALGMARVLHYQDAAYAERYLQRMRRVSASERGIDPTGAHGHATTIEAARWLALWMAFDDIVRVADLKSRRSRHSRVAAEVRAQPGDLLRIHDYFKPGAPEFAALLPAPLASRILAWDRRRLARGLDPWAMPLKVSAHSVRGMLALRILASLKWLRVRGSRFADEQAAIDHWLDGVCTATTRQWALGHEIAQCGRLIKGYGSTNTRAKGQLLHMLQHLAQGGSFADDAARASAIAAARSAALADDAGQLLDQALRQHGAPAREPPAQPIRWVKTPPGRSASHQLRQNPPGGPPADPRGAAH